MQHQNSNMWVIFQQSITSWNLKWIFIYNIRKLKLRSDVFFAKLYFECTCCDYKEYPRFNGYNNMEQCDMGSNYNNEDSFKKKRWHPSQCYYLIWIKIFSVMAVQVRSKNKCIISYIFLAVRRKRCYKACKRSARIFKKRLVYHNKSDI